MKTIGIITIIAYHIGAKPEPFMNHTQGSGTDNTAGQISIQPSICGCDTTEHKIIYIKDEI